MFDSLIAMPDAIVCFSSLLTIVSVKETADTIAKLRRKIDRQIVVLRPTTLHDTIMFYYNQFTFFFENRDNR